MEPSTTPSPPASFAQRFGAESLRRAVYVSKAAPGHEHGPETLADILRVSRAKNRAAGITGLLVYFDGRFLQCLEGPGLAVYGTLALIREDARHRDMEILLDERTHHRLFKTWDMGCLEVGSVSWQRLVQADWPTLRPLGRHSASGLTVLQDLARHPVDADDLPAILGRARQAPPLSRAARDALPLNDTLSASAGRASPGPLASLVLFATVLVLLVLDRFA